MKYITTLSFIICSCISFAQVGIGTIDPQADLHVVGDLLVQNTFITKSLNTVLSTEENFHLLSRVTNSSPLGELKFMNVDSLNVAPVNVINYTFTNISLDNLTDVNLQYDSSKYIVAVSNFRYVGDAIKKDYPGSEASVGNFVFGTFVDEGSWHLEIKNRTLDLNSGDSVTYHVTLIIYDKLYFRELTSIFTNLGGSNTGSASSIPVLE